MTASVYLDRPTIPKATTARLMVTPTMWRALADRHAWAARHEQARTCRAIADRIDNETRK